MNTQLLQRAEDFAKQRLYGEASGHDWWHVERVLATARQIQKVEGGDMLIIELALILHDVGDRKVIGEDDDDYTIAEGFLVEQGASDHIVQTVMEIIKTMSYSRSFEDSAKPSSIEFYIVQDADRLDAIGTIGIARTFAFGGQKGRPLYNPDQTTTAYQSRDEYIASQSSSLHHFDEKLFLIKDMLNTATAKQIAADRDHYMREFKRRFLDEWDGKR